MQIPYFWCVLVDDHRWRRRRRRRSGGGGIAGGRSFFFKFASPHGEQRRRSSGPLFNAKAIYEMDVTSSSSSSVFPCSNHTSLFLLTHLPPLRQAA